MFSISVIHAQHVLQMTDFENPPVIDGTINPDEWVVQDSISTLIQLEPDRGEESTRRTIVYAGQDKTSIYFAYKCYTHNPNEITARIQRRDLVDDSDDIVALMLDTYNDKRTSLLFFVNVIGTLSDAKIADDGRNLDFNWDTEWEAHTLQDENGWYVLGRPKSPPDNELDATLTIFAVCAKIK